MSCHLSHILIASILYTICSQADQFKASTSPSSWSPQALDCHPCPGGEAFETCQGGVGNLKGLKKTISNSRILRYCHPMLYHGTTKDFHGALAHNLSSQVIKCVWANSNLQQGCILFIDFFCLGFYRCLQGFYFLLHFRQFFLMFFFQTSQLIS